MSRPETLSLFPDHQPAPVGRDEMNFAEFPMAVLSARAPKGCTELVFEDSYLHKGLPLTRRLTVAASAKYGLPTVKDEEVLLGLLKLTKQKNNLTSQNLETSRYELVQTLGWNDEGHSYKRISEALDCWASVYLKYENAWWDNERKEHVDVAFHLIDSWLVGRKEQGKRGGRLVVKWSEVAFRSFQSNYVKQLDLAFYQSLKSGVTKRLFRYLDKHLYHRPHRREFDLADLAFEHVGLSRDYAPWKVKQLLEPAIRELEERSYLKPVPADARFIPAGRGRYRIVFEKKKTPQAALAEVPEPKASPLVAELTARGLVEKSARQLVERFTADEVSLQLEVFDWLMGRKDRRVSGSPPGYLFKAIENGYPIPHGFIPKSVAKAKADELRQQQVEDRRKLRDEAAKGKAEKVRADERRVRVEAFLRTLSGDTRAEFEEAALTGGPAEMVEAYTKALGLGLKAFTETQRYLLLEHAMTGNASRSMLAPS